MSDLTITAKQLLEAVSGLRKIGVRDLTATGAYAIAKAKRQADGALVDLEAARKGLIDKYAAKNEKGEPIELPDKTVDLKDPAGFQAAWVSLIAEPVTLSGVRPLRVEEIVGPVSADELFSLGPFVAEPTEPVAQK